jgi:transposase-like protein
LKREIVAAALAPGSSVSKAARAYDVKGLTTLPIEIFSSLQFQG